jgi:TRAP-type mannitol/chloroaromatic compound transport system substrate-binding protein
MIDLNYLRTLFNGKNNMIGLASSLIKFNDFRNEYEKLKKDYENILGEEVDEITLSMIDNTEIYNDDIEYLNKSYKELEEKIKDEILEGYYVIKDKVVKNELKLKHTDHIKVLLDYWKDLIFEEVVAMVNRDIEKEN